MALVHIEMSEYKAMEAKAEMLEEMRQTERKLHEEIKSLEQERNEENKKLQEENAKLLKEANDKVIEAYETAEKKVVKTVRHTTEEVVYLNRDDRSYIIKEFLYSLGIDPYRLEAMEPGYYGGRMRGHNVHKMDIDRLRNAFFVKDFIKKPDKVTTTLHGFDEVTAEMELRLRAELTLGLEKELEEAKETLEKYNTLSEQASLLRDKIESVENLNRELINKLEEKEYLVKHYKAFEGGYKEILAKTRNANWWTKLTFYKIIKNLISKNERK